MFVYMDLLVRLTCW